MTDALRRTSMRRIRCWSKYAAWWTTAHPCSSVSRILAQCASRQATASTLPQRTARCSAVGPTESNHNNTHDNAYFGVITKNIARVHLVYLTNVEQRQVLAVADSQPKCPNQENHPAECTKILFFFSNFLSFKICRRMQLLIYLPVAKPITDSQPDQRRQILNNRIDQDSLFQSQQLAYRE